MPNCAKQKPSPVGEGGSAVGELWMIDGFAAETDEVVLQQHYSNLKNFYAQLCKTKTFSGGRRWLGGRWIMNNRLLCRRDG